MDGSEPAERGATLPWGAAASADADVGVAFPSRWRIARQLGRGGQADVWLARDTELDEWVAIKVFRSGLSAAQRERIRREVRLGRSMVHPNLVRVYELLESSERLAVVMEWVPEGSLAQRLGAGVLPIGHVIQAAADTLAALAFLHDHRVVHRDIKPSNLLLDNAGRVRLADLGLVRPLEAGGDLTQTSMTVGTPAYMSPEQLRGEELTPASDLYGLGVTLYELITGAPPFVADSEFAVSEGHLHRRPRDPRASRPACPRWLARFVMRLLEKQPGDRWPDAGVALRAFERQRAVVSPRVVRLAKRAAVLVVGAGALATAVVTVLVPLFAGGEAVEVEAAASQVRGVDRHGRVAWTIQLEAPIQRRVRADLDGDGIPETVVTANPGTASMGTGDGTRSEVLVVRTDGTVLTRVSPEERLERAWTFPYPRLLDPIPRVIDLDGDDRPELALLCQHRWFYPFALLVYWPRHDHWDAILVHSGWLSDIAVVPGSSPPRVRFAGVNNRLGILPVAGEVVITAPSPGLPLEDAQTLGPPDLGPSASGRWAYSWYTVLEQGRNPTGISLAPDGASAVAFARIVGAPVRTLRVDRWGNPVPGPNAGRRLAELRSDFLSRLGTLMEFEPPTNLDALRDRVDSIETGMPELLEEAPYRALLRTTHGRALARLGDLDGAVRLLEEAVADTRYEETRYRLVHLLALDGRLGEASALAERMVNAPWNQRGGYDGARMLVRIAVELRDEGFLPQAFQKVRGPFLQSSDERTRAEAALWARAHLWWDAVGEADCAVRSWAYVPEGDAIAALARWRLGRAEPGEVERVRAAAAANPDAEWENQVALSAALLGSGRIAEAAASLERTIATLEPLSRDDFMNRQTLDLARSVYVAALAAGGERARALAEARRIRPTLRDRLLPAKLVDEVIRGVGTPGRATDQADAPRVRREGAESASDSR
ncbi:MAG: serine/threonine-protein kinase [Acidobacteriota bacterium]